MVVFLPGNFVSVHVLCDAQTHNYMCRTTWSVWLRDQKFMSLCNCILCMHDYELCVCDVCPCCPTPDSQGTTVEAPHVAPWILPLGRQKSGISKAQGKGWWKSTAGQLLLVVWSNGPILSSWEDQLPFPSPHHTAGAHVVVPASTST